MKNHTLMAAASLGVIGLAFTVTVYVSSLQAAAPAGSKNTPRATTAAEQIMQLQAQIATLERRIAALEKRPSLTFWPDAQAPVIPRSAPGQPQDENEGFPPARILLIHESPGIQPAR